LIGEHSYGVGRLYKDCEEEEKLRSDLVDFSRIWFEKVTTGEFLDCLVFATNAAIGCKWVVTREQVIRLIKARMAKDESKVLSFK
jgi:hypothetical protein